MRLACRCRELAQVLRLSPPTSLPRVWQRLVRICQQQTHLPHLGLAEGFAESGHPGQVDAVGNASDYFVPVFADTRMTAWKAGFG